MSGGLARQPRQPLPQHVLEELEDIALRIGGPVSAARLWERVLTPQERQRLGGDLEVAWRGHGGTAGMWMALRQVSRPRAVLDVPHEIGLLTDGNYRWLLREIGELHDDPEDALQAAVRTGGLVLVERPGPRTGRGG
jgi:hypothetical protein